jgi:hypothetical protein
MESKALYSLWVCMLFFAQCGVFVIMPTVTAKTFGQKNFTAIYGFVLISSVTNF